MLVSQAAFMRSARDVFCILNADYLAVHKTKEALFWAACMATSTDDTRFIRAEASYKKFISDPELLASVRTALARLPSDDNDVNMRELRDGVSDWQAPIECNVVESDPARVLMREHIKLESHLFARQREHALPHINEAGELENEQMSSAQRFIIFDYFEGLMRHANLRSLNDLTQKYGAEAT